MYVYIYIYIFIYINIRNLCYYKQNRLDTVNLIITQHRKTIFNKYGFIRSCLCMLRLQLSQVHW